MQILIDISEDDYNNIAPFLNGEPIKGGFNLFKALEIIKNGIPLQDLYDLEGLKSDMKALNCGYPYGLDYLLNCLNNRLGITIIEADKAGKEQE